ncbi:hypothetical protein [Aquiflexum sp.]|uniref:hypothetical protein n=1 Tax=Aquiflexum sp. TaxID=1872584 RepID=UPI00359366A9
MKKRTLIYAKWAFVSAIGFLMLACNDNKDEVLDEPQSQASLSATAHDGSTNPSGRVIVNGFSTAEFKVATKDVEMRYAAKADILAGISLGNITLKTNVNTSLQSSTAKEQSLTLISDGSVRSSTMGSGSTPDGKYQEVNFRLFKNSSAPQSDPMFNKSLWLSGEANGKACIIWMEAEKMIVAKAESSQGVDVDGQSDMELVFDLEKLFANVNFSTAVDSNLHGKIDIGPGSVDANAAIFTQIESNLESAVVFKKK